MIEQTIDFKCTNLSLKLGNKSLFHHFNFSFTGPGIVMIEGENGSGKSSLLKVWAGFIIPDTGEIKLPKNPKEFSFLTTTSLGLLNDLTGSEHIHLIASALTLDSANVQKKILEFREIEVFDEILVKRVSDFSQGMKQILRLFLHLFFEPKVLFLDEPFLYLSPKLKEFIQEKIEHLAKQSLIFITDQKFTWEPEAKIEKIALGAK